MFVGHAAVAFASKRAAPRAPLGWLMAAAFLPDLVWPVLLLAGIERVRIEPGATAVTPLDFVHYPWTHSFVATALWAAALAGAYAALKRDREGALWIALGVLSHWALDAVSHRPDLPVWPGGPRVGLGLWNSRAATLALEGSTFAVAVAVYARGFPARGGAGQASLWSLVALFVVAYAGAVFGPPPPHEGAVAWTGLASLLFIPWAAWIERTRPTTRP